MAEITLAKVILYIDGSVHLCLQDYRTFYVSANSLIRFFENPLNFINYDVNQEKESTQIVNPTRRPLDKLTGVCLLQYTSAGKSICNFQELYQFVFSAANDENMRNKPLNMQSFILEQNLSNSKSFLLKYYLDFVNSFDKNTTIKNKLEIDEDVLFSTLREIFNSVFSIEPIKVKSKNLDDRVGDIKHKQLFITGTSDKSSNMIPVSEYAALHEVPRSDVLRLIKDGKLKTAIKGDNGRYVIDRNEPLIALRKNSLNAKRSVSDNEENQYLGSHEDWPAVRVEQYIKEKRLFSSVVAKYIYSKQELDYYIKAKFMEIDWNNRRCLIQDVNPDFKTEDGVSNRERMLNGEPPLSLTPEGECKAWEIHHLGQRNKVFVTLQYHIHHGSGFYAIFHSSAPNEDLHGIEFEKEKIRFWKHYISLYDNATSFEKIPHIYPNKTTRL